MRVNRPPYLARTPRAVQAARRSLVALAFGVPLVLIGVGAALTASTSVAALVIFEACGVVYPLTCVLLLELGPAGRELWRITAGARRAARRFANQLDALPETAHPLGA
jgi:hypothetical protein